METSTFYCVIQSPVGPLTLTSDGSGLSGVLFANQTIAPLPGWIRDERPLVDAVEQLRAYFAGERRVFDLSLSLRGTPFQVRVWNALRDIPYAVTTSYRALAEVLGKPSAARAVGAANARNPLPIVLPCHRVVGADGSLTGFAGGIERKRWLLQFERDGAPVNPAEHEPRRMGKFSDNSERVAEATTFA